MFPCCHNGIPVFLGLLLNNFLPKYIPDLHEDPCSSTSVPICKSDKWKNFIFYFPFQRCCPLCFLFLSYPLSTFACIFFFSLFIGLCLVIKMDRKKIIIVILIISAGQRSADLIRSHSCLYSWTCLVLSYLHFRESFWLTISSSIMEATQTWKCKIPQLQHYSVDCMGSFTGSGIHTSIWTSVPEWTDPRCSHLYCTYENHQKIGYQGGLTHGRTEKI